MPVIISHLSYKVYSDSEDIPLVLKHTQEDVENKIKGTDCGAYHNIKCATCGKLDPICAGHWHKLIMPNIALYIKSYDHIILRISESVCFAHKGLPFNLNALEDIDDEVSYNKKVRQLLVEAKEKGCLVCRNRLDKIICAKKDDSIKFVNPRDYREVNPITMYNIICSIPHRIQKIITKQPTRLQEMFYHGSIPVVPTYLRVSSKFDRVNEYAHYLTNRYLEIVSLLKEYNRHDLPQETKNLIVVRMQIKLNEIIDGKETVDSKKESCSGYLKTKFNLFREFINGKRNPKTARVVLNVNELPKLNYFFPCVQYIENITTAIPYNKYTIRLIDDLINQNEVNGYFSHSKNKFIQSTAIQGIQLGDFVECSMAYGDRLVLNGRQPALHLTNIYVGKAIITSRPFHNSQSTQLPTAVLPGMNGDQDGDEVWSKEVQDIKSKYEQMMLMLPGNSMISPGHGGINYGIIQDELLSINILLKARLSYNNAIQLLGPYVDYFAEKCSLDCDIFKGRDVISAVIPNHFNKTDVIRNGVIEHQRIQSSDFGVGGGTVNSITKSLMDYDRRLAKEFLESILTISKNVISLYPCSIRLTDIISDLKEWISINNHKKSMYRQIDYNHKQYLYDCRDKKTIPMDEDYKIKFIKLEVAKVVNEITSRANKIVSKYIDQFNKGEKFNRLVLYILAGYKLDIATLSIIYCQANPSIEPKSVYLNRLFPCFTASDPNLDNMGLVSSSLVEGLDFKQMALLASKARENVVTTVCRTASKGEIGRYIIKNLENYTIAFGCKFLVLDKQIASHCLNVYKMPVKQLYLVRLDISVIKNCLHDSSLLSRTIMKYFNEVVHYMYDLNTQKYEFQVAYVTDIQLCIQSYRSECVLSDDEIVHNTEEFFDRISCEYMYDFSTTSMLKLVTLVMCMKYGVHKDGLSKLFDIIELKYKKYPEVGAPTGIEAGTSIGEVETQSTLSAHLQFTKNGCDVKSTQSNTNISLMKINVKKSSQKKIFKLMSKNIDALQKIKNGLEFVSLEDIALEINFTPKTVPEEYVLVTCKISTLMLDNMQLPEFYVDHMFIHFCNSIIFITKSKINIVYEGDLIMVYMRLSMSLRFLPSLKLMIKQGVSKGIFSLYRYTIDKSEILDTETLTMQHVFIMNCEIPSIKHLAMFDTSDIIITPPIDVAASLGTAHAYNMLSRSYTSSGLMKFHTSLLSLHQIRHGSILRVDKNPKKEMTTISKIAFIKPMKDLQNAAQEELKESTDDLSSSILLSQVVKQGTGVIDVVQSLDRYINDNSSCCLNTLVL